MKRIISLTSYIIIIVSSLIMAGSCTRNNGNIGVWFGTWKVVSITDDGKPLDGYAPPYAFFKFQSQLMEIVIPDEGNISYPVGLGLWHEEDGLLYLDFSNETVPGVLHPIPLDRISVLDIIKKSHREIILSYMALDGHKYTFNLKKWG